MQGKVIKSYYSILTLCRATRPEYQWWCCGAWQIQRETCTTFEEPNDSTWFVGLFSYWSISDQPLISVRLACSLPFQVLIWQLLMVSSELDWVIASHPPTPSNNIKVTGVVWGFLIKTQIIEHMVLTWQLNFCPNYDSKSYIPIKIN